VGQPYILAMKAGYFAEDKEGYKKGNSKTDQEEQDAPRNSSGAI
jgi:hypothetical protein